MTKRPCRRDASRVVQKMKELNQERFRDDDQQDEQNKDCAGGCEATVSTQTSNISISYFAHVISSSFVLCHKVFNSLCIDKAIYVIFKKRARSAPCHMLEHEDYEMMRPFEIFSAHRCNKKSTYPKKHAVLAENHNSHLNELLCKLN